MIIKNLKKELGNFKIDIENLSMDEPLIYGLMGANGSGKSSLAKLIMKIIEPDSGHIDYQGIGYQEKTYMSQEPYIIKDSLINNIIYPLKIRNLKIDYEKINTYLLKAGLLDKKDQEAHSLSSGERQKLSFIRSIIFDPRLIIIDETLSNLDIESTNTFLQWMLDIQKESPRIWIFISHQLSHLERVCDKIIFINEGSIENFARTDQILNYEGQGPLRRFLDDRIIGGSL